MYRIGIGIGLTAVGVSIRLGLSMASGQQQLQLAPGVDSQLLTRVDAGANRPAFTVL
jgi:F0F1-type ATP synthase membrane subunit c/vacuolar-type H+-ATPase subunit K